MTVCNSRCGKVMFSQVSVILSTGGRCTPPGQTPWVDTPPLQADTPPGRHPTPPKYIAIFPVYLGMALMFRFLTLHMVKTHFLLENLRISEPSLGIPEIFQSSSALPNIKYTCAVLFWSQLYWLFSYASKYIFSV